MSTDKNLCESYERKKFKLVLGARPIFRLLFISDWYFDIQLYLISLGP